MKNSLIASIAAPIIVFSLAVSGSAVAAPSASSAPNVLWYKSEVVNKKSTSNTIGSAIIGSCTVAAKGATCTITAGKSITRTIGTTLGITREGVAASLSISAAATVTSSVSCTSPKLAAGGSWRAKPYGTAYTYQVARKTYDTEIVGELARTTSGTLKAFNPSGNRIYCY